jgi:hypothetical protein
MIAATIEPIDKYALQTAEAHRPKRMHCNTDAPSSSDAGDGPPYRLSFPVSLNGSKPELRLMLKWKVKLSVTTCVV